METTFIPDVHMYVCNNCGAHALREEDIEHFPNCKPGESKYWEEHYNEAYEEERG